MPPAVRRSAPLALLAALGLTAGLAFPQNGGAQGRKVALLVGVNRYANRGFADLRFAERDVEELARLLKGGGFEVELLVGEDTTLGRVEQGVAKLLAGRDKRDLVLIGLAGHGVQAAVQRGGAERVEALFCPRDAVKNDPATMLSVSALLEKLDARGGGTNLLLVDACREDPNRGARGLDGGAVRNLPEGVAALLSCRAGQVARESPALKHGVFFYHVLEGLRGKARNDEGAVTWDDLRSYVKRRVPAATLEEFHARQQPQDISNLVDDTTLLAARVKPLTYISDNANLFTRDGARKADRGIAELVKRYNRELRVETFREVPGGKEAGGGEPREWSEFFQKWGRQRATELKVNGIYLLICMKPSRLQVEVGDHTIQKAFRRADRDELVRLLADDFRKKDFDRGLSKAVTFVGGRLAANSRDAD